MSDTTREHLDTFWELIDEIFNAVLFLLIGLEVLVVAFSGPVVLLALLAIPIALAGARRQRSVCLWRSCTRSGSYEAGAKRVLVWGGLRGGISVALALSLPPGAAPRRAPRGDLRRGAVLHPRAGADGPAARPPCDPRCQPAHAGG